MEEKKATRDCRVGIRPFNAHNVVQSTHIEMPAKLGRKKSHSPNHFLRGSMDQGLQSIDCIEGPNSNFTIRSGFFFFHRGLPF